MPEKPPKKIVVERLPRSQGVVERHMVAAYIWGSKHHQRRIEVWGRMQRKILHSIGAPAKKDGTQLTRASAS
jgi:hypothetical protein